MKAIGPHFLGPVQVFWSASKEGVDGSIVFDKEGVVDSILCDFFKSYLYEI